MISKREFKNIYIISFVLIFLSMIALPMGQYSAFLENNSWYILNFNIIIFSALHFLLIPLAIYYNVISYKSKYVIVPLVLLIIATWYLWTTIYGFGAAKTSVVPLVIYMLLISSAVILKDKNIKYVNLIFMALTYFIIFLWQYDGKIYSSLDQITPVEVYRSIVFIIALAIPQIIARPFFRKYSNS